MQWWWCFPSVVTSLFWKESHPHYPEMSSVEKAHLQHEAKQMFYHGYNSYMSYGFPWDELKPLSCTGRRWDQKERGDLDDTLGGFSLTLIDSLDMLAIVQDYDEFRRAAITLINIVMFDRNVRVSVFESTIRVLGGLLSAHMLAKQGLFPDYLQYQRFNHTNETNVGNGALLEMAIDLANRLLPAFETPTGIPYHRVNLRFGQIPNEKLETCPAAAGSLLLEMALLSRLSGNSIYEDVSKRAVLALWQRRSKHDLLGSTINIRTGKWVHSHTGIGAGLDSFYEYLLKYYIMFGDYQFLNMFYTSYASIEDQLRHGDWHVEVDMHAGKNELKYSRVSALQAFWPGLQVLAGDVKGAIGAHRKLYTLWKKFSAMPEVYDVQRKEIVHWAKNYPLRPELVESTFHLYQATKDPFYLHVGKKILFDLQNNTKVKCGYASIANVMDMRLEDRMDSYFLSETVKYLYLLFKAADDPVITVPEKVTSTTFANGTVVSSSVMKKFSMNQVIFSTEGHVFLLSPNLQPSQQSTSMKRKPQGLSNQCPKQSLKPTTELVKLKLAFERCKAAPQECAFDFPKLAIRLAFGSYQTHALTAFPALFGRMIAPENPIAGQIFLLMNGMQLSYGCEPIHKDLSARIVLLQRGQCSFVTKARNVQLAGGIGVILGNTVDTTDARLQVLTDDGTSHDIKIPIVMISKDSMSFVQKKITRWHRIRERNLDWNPIVGVLYNLEI